MSAACDACVRRGALIGLLAGRIEAVLDAREKRRAYALLSLSDDELIDVVGGSARPAAEEFLAAFDPNMARAALADADCGILCYHAEQYPEPLANLHDPPSPLYVKGGLDRFVELLARPAVAIVGARECSQYARGVAEEMGRGIAAAGVTVVSGLARGIDGAAHLGAVAGGGGAIAVLAGGPDYVYPKRHASLYAELLETGVVISELPPGVRPRRWGFPARNRIMAGLADLVVVVEAARGSGSLITADFKQGIHGEVAAVPGPVNARIAAGSNKLLKEGAAFVRDADDVLDLVFGVGQGPRPKRRPPKLEPTLRKVLDGVEVGDSLPATARRAALSAGELRGALGRLEALGLVRRDAVGGYVRSAAR